LKSRLPNFTIPLATESSDFEVSADPGEFAGGAALPLTAIFENRIWSWLAQKISSLRAGALYGSVPSLIPDAVIVVPVAA